jgi:hypothetical protein
MLWISVAIWGPNQANDSSFCKGLQQALAESQRIKAGMKRGEVERYFHVDGGVQFPNSGRYVYQSCAYLKIVVEYELAPKRGGQLSSADDIVKGVSKPFVDFPTMD